MNKQELAEQIAKAIETEFGGYMPYRGEGYIISQTYIYKSDVLRVSESIAAIVEAMNTSANEKPCPQLSPEEVLYKHILTDADNHVKGTTLVVNVPPLEELKNNQQFQMHVAAMKEYAQQFQQSEGEAISDSPKAIIDAYENYINVLNDEINDLVGTAAIHGWESRNIERGEQARKQIAAAKEAISVPPSISLKQVVENDTIEALVMDYITFLELDKLGKLAENGTLDYENMNSVFPCIRKAKKRINERQFFLLKDILTKRVSQQAISVPAQEDDSDRELEITTDRNMDLISDFIEHLKDEAGIEIPESAVLSFFNA